MEKTMVISFIYGICTVLSLLFAGGYCALMRKKENWLIWLYFSVFVANLGYFTLSISKTLEEALLANRLAYLGCVFLSLFMLMTIAKVCHLSVSKLWLGVFIGISTLVFLVAASQGYFDLYYREVSLVFIDGAAKLVKVYGPLHNLYYIYLFAYFALMVGVICYAVAKKKVDSGKHAGLLVAVVLLNIAIWLVEQLINWNFEFLAVSYIASELLLLFLYGMIQDYEAIAEQNGRGASYIGTIPVFTMEQAIEILPEISFLSVREKEVLEKMLADKKRKEIAEELYITENTVKKHISSIFTKLHISSREELFTKINQ